MAHGVLMPLIKGHAYHAALLAIFLANVLACIAIAFGDGYLPTGWAEATSRWQSIAPAGLGFVLVGVLNSQLSPDTKARIIFARYRNPLPGARAFTELGPADPRVDMAKLEQKLGPLPIEPVEQNRTWYGLYRSIRDEATVLGIHRDYLFYRDYGSAAVIMLFLLSAGALCFADHWQPIALYAVLLVIQAALAVRAARDRGRRFVTTVLAIKAAE